MGSGIQTSILSGIFSEILKTEFEKNRVYVIGNNNWDFNQDFENPLKEVHI